MKYYRTLLDVVFILACINVLDKLIRLFWTSLNIFQYINLGEIVPIIFFVLIFNYARKNKKWGTINLGALTIIGYIITEYIAGNLWTSNNSLAQTLNTMGNLLFIIGALTIIIFYIVDYRKYLSSN